MDTVDRQLTPVEFLGEMRRQFGSAPSYTRLWNAMCRGDVPAERDGGRWKLRSGHVPLAAKILGIKAAA